jgi:hypothetical protein
MQQSGRVHTLHWKDNDDTNDDVQGRSEEDGSGASSSKDDADWSASPVEERHDEAGGRFSEDAERADEDDDDAKIAASGTQAAEREVEILPPLSETEERERDDQAEKDDDAIESRRTDIEHEDDTEETDEARRNTLISSELPQTPAPPTMAEHLRTPMLAIAATVAALIAAWSYSTLQGTRAELEAMATAKATAEQALVDAKAKLSAVEKALTDINSALSAGAAAAATATTPPAAAKP